MRYHINAEGRKRPCNATKRPCRFDSSMQFSNPRMTAVFMQWEQGRRTDDDMLAEMAEHGSSQEWNELFDHFAGNFDLEIGEAFLSGAHHLTPERRDKLREALGEDHPYNVETRVMDGTASAADYDSWVDTLLPDDRNFPHYYWSNADNMQRAGLPEKVVRRIRAEKPRNHVYGLLRSEYFTSDELRDIFDEHMNVVGDYRHEAELKNCLACLQENPNCPPELRESYLRQLR